MPTLEELLAWGRGEVVAGLPKNEPVGERTEVSIETVDEKTRRMRAEMRGKLVRAKAAKVGGLSMADAVARDQIIQPVTKERITLLLDRASRSGDARLGFGKHKDKMLSETPRDYVAWCKKSFVRASEDYGPARPCLVAVATHIITRKPLELPAEYVPAAWADFGRTAAEAAGDGERFAARLGASLTSWSTAWWAPGKLNLGELERVLTPVNRLLIERGLAVELHFDPSRGARLRVLGKSELIGVHVVEDVEE